MIPESPDKVNTLPKKWAPAPAERQEMRLAGGGKSVLTKKSEKKLKNVNFYHQHLPVPIALNVLGRI